MPDVAEAKALDHCVDGAFLRKLGQRFLVLSHDGKANTNLVWKDTVLVGAGALLARRASQRWQRLREDTDTTDIAAGDAIEAGRNPA